MHAPSSSRVKTAEAKRLARARQRQVAAHRLGHRPGVGRQSYLEKTAVFSHTRNRNYLPVLMSFGLLAIHFGVDLSAKIPDPSIGDSLDAAAVDWCDQEFFEGHSGPRGSLLAAALADHWPATSQRSGTIGLPRFARAVQSWKRQAPGHTRDPLPWLHLMLVLYQMTLIGQHVEALACLVCYICYFRPSELVSILVEDVLAPSHSSRHVAIALHPEDRGVPSKTGVFNDGVAVDNPRVPWLGRRLLKFARQRRRGQLLFGLTYRQLNAAYVAAATAAGLPDTSMHRMRHGGASEDRAANLRPLDVIKRRGRWTTDSAVRRYEPVVRFQRVEGQLDASALKRARLVEAELEKVLFGGSQRE